VFLTMALVNLVMTITLLRNIDVEKAS
jgi:hypothetical protein